MPPTKWEACLRAVPEIILGGAAFFFRPLHPQDTHGVRAPQPPGHVSALINLPHYESNMPWPPGQVTLHPPLPLGHVNKTPSPTGHKRACSPPTPQDNFWNSPNYTFQLIYITGQSAPKPDTDTKTSDTLNHRAIEVRTVWVSSQSFPFQN